MHILGEGFYVLDEQAKRIAFVRSTGKEDVDYCPWDTNLVACLGVYEQLQGHIVLHAQVLEWRESAVVIVGRSGMGKSSIGGYGNVGSRSAEGWSSNFRLNLKYSIASPTSL